MQYIGIFLMGYLIGSLPFSYLIARYWKGIDIRQTGSGNVGSTNVWRNAGTAAGLLAFACDFGKGSLVVVLAGCFGGANLVVTAAIAVLVGHSWPVFLGFKGGKMVATGVGVIMAISPIIGGISMIAWLIILFITRYVSLASIITLIGIPVLMLYYSLELPYVLLGILMAVVTTVRHFPNIKRLMAGTEPKVKYGLRLMK